MLCVGFCRTVQTLQKTRKWWPNSHEFQAQYSICYSFSQMNVVSASECESPDPSIPIHPGRSRGSRSRSGLHLTCHIHHDESCVLLLKCQWAQSCRKTQKQSNYVPPLPLKVIKQEILCATDTQPVASAAVSQRWHATHTCLSFFITSPPTS